jgi:hypothetical protein
MVRYVFQDISPLLSLDRCHISFLCTFFSLGVSLGSPSLPQVTELFSCGFLYDGQQLHKEETKTQEDVLIYNNLLSRSH